eukprot:Plantae.Rhodophyta-Purpureofilum_apyrenoidigerum.ctg28779.p2 GENE.Plantae.Rhodophyta-Purpureofilum_apyrenoidigerum.ctg28779~~Plantae.Rhodophyta-Purpureofilum_apyrenoidigerum.ctg28779.p2  ORF type:complete len:133 (+),score=18.77 Plantae.Rhodophyta-Purpureofilum_apyrenoidigerum.ctg28779:242-640(+)
MKIGFDHLSALFNQVNRSGLLNRRSIEVTNSKEVMAVTRVLIDEGYVLGMRPSELNRHKLEVFLKYHNGKHVIREARRFSTPGRKYMVRVAFLPPNSRGLGVWVLKTPRGIMSDTQARRQGVLMGELVGSVF